MCLCAAGTAGCWGSWRCLGHLEMVSTNAVESFQPQTWGGVSSQPMTGKNRTTECVALSQMKPCDDLQLMFAASFSTGSSFWPVTDCSKCFLLMKLWNLSSTSCRCVSLAVFHLHLNFTSSQLPAWILTQLCYCSIVLSGVFFRHTFLMEMHISSPHTQLWDFKLPFSIHTD